MRALSPSSSLGYLPISCSKRSNAIPKDPMIVCLAAMILACCDLPKKRGTTIAASTLMIVMTSSSSMSVNAFCFLFFRISDVLLSFYINIVLVWKIGSNIAITTNPMISPSSTIIAGPIKLVIAVIASFDCWSYMSAISISISGSIPESSPTAIIDDVISSKEERSFIAFAIEFPFETAWSSFVI